MTAAQAARERNLILGAFCAVIAAASVVLLWAAWYYGV